MVGYRKNPTRRKHVAVGNPDYRLLEISSEPDIGERILAHVVAGIVVEVDHSGRLLTDINAEKIVGAPRDDAVSIKFGGHETVGLYDQDHGQPKGTMVAILQKTGCVEIEIVGMNLAEMLGISTGTAVQVAW